jgi:hypothetical protein
VDEKDPIVGKVNSKLLPMSFHPGDTETPERRFGCFVCADAKFNLDLFPSEYSVQLSRVVVNERTFCHDDPV